MSNTKTSDEVILENAPEGATHVDSDGDYCKMNGERWDCYSCDSKTWFYYEEAISLRSLADIEAIVERDKKIARLEKAFPTINVFESEVRIRKNKLERQAKDKRIAELEAKVAELEESQAKWVSVKDDLPDEDALVVGAYIYPCLDEPDAACFNFYNGKFVLNDDGLEASNYDGGAIVIANFVVTHWMPLPKPPEVKK